MSEQKNDLKPRLLELALSIGGAMTAGDLARAALANHTITQTEMSSGAMKWLRSECGKVLQSKDSSGIRRFATLPPTEGDNQKVYKQLDLLVVDESRTFYFGELIPNLKECYHSALKHKEWHLATFSETLELPEWELD